MLKEHLNNTAQRHQTVLVRYCLYIHLSARLKCRSCYLCSANVRSDWVNSYFFRLGWALPDGRIGCNAIMGSKYPDVSELVDEWAKYLTICPSLDLIAVIT